MEVEKLHSQLQESKRNQSWHKMKTKKLGGRQLSEHIKSRIQGGSVQDIQANLCA